MHTLLFFRDYPGLNSDLQPQSGGGNSYNSHTQNGHSNQQAHNNQPAPLPPLPPGKELPPGVTCTDAISRTLNTLPPAQLLDVLQQMKALATHEPGRAAQLLTEAPQLSYAVFQALLLLGLVSPEAINSVVEADGYGAPMIQPGGYAPPEAAAPVAVAAAPAPAAAAPEQDPEALMRAVMELPQAMIDQLPEAERQQILALRASYAQQRR